MLCVHRKNDVLTHTSNIQIETFEKLDLKTFMNSHFASKLTLLDIFLFLNLKKIIPEVKFERKKSFFEAMIGLLT